MHFDARGYVYESHREGGRVCRRYVGSGEFAALLRRSDELLRERKANERRAQLEAQKQEEAVADELRAFCDLAGAVLCAHLEENGFHRHKRGAWRKRRANLNDMAKPSKALATGTNELAALDTQTLTSKATNGDSNAAAEVWRTIREQPDLRAEMVRDWGDAARQARLSLLGKMFGKDELAKLATRAKVGDMMRELSGPSPSPLETLLAERIASCWLSLAYFEAVYSLNMGELSLNQAAFHLKRIDGAHRRYLESIKALATVRKLQLPTVQVNIGEKQVNIAQMNGAPAPMDEEARGIEATG